MAATLVAQSRVVMVLWLIWLGYPAEAIRKTDTLNLASMRIYSAELQLRESNVALKDHCRPQLEAMRDKLHVASTRVVIDPEEARRKLAQVNEFLQICSQSLTAAVDVATSSQSLARDLITRVGLSVVSAAALIDQIDVADTVQAPVITSQDMITASIPAGAILEDDDAASGLLEMITSEVRRGHELGWTRSGVGGSEIDVPMDDLVIDFCPTHVATTRSTATILLDRDCGGKFHTQGKYASGVFSILMRAPARAAGASNSFFISSNDAASDVISFDFVGAEPNRVLTSYAVRGDHDQKLKTFHMDFDTTLAFHRYTIKWDTTSVAWIVDDVILRTLHRSSHTSSYPSKPGHVYGYSWDSSNRIDFRNAPFVMCFRDFQITSVHQWRAQRRASTDHLHLLPMIPTFVRPLVIDYCPSNTAAHHTDGVDITFDDSGCGGRVRSLHAYPSGRFTARIKCAAGDTSGLLTSFYISSREGTTSQDEVDFEFLGDNKRIVQTNFYVNGTSAANEQWVDLQYDCSEAFHTYTIEYSSSQIRWLVDSRLVRSVARNDDDDHQVGAFPRKKMFLYSSVWNASFVNDGRWTGKWHGNVSELPFVASFRNVTMALL